MLATFINRDGQHLTKPPLGGPGFLQIVLRLDPLLGSTWSRATGALLDVMLVDESDDSPVHLHSRIDGRDHAGLLGDPPPDFINSSTLVRQVQVGGRLWRAYYRPRAAWVASRRIIAPRLAFFGTGLLTLVSVAYLNTLFRRTERVSREVGIRTAELAESRALLYELIDHNPSIIWMKDSDLRYQLINLRFASAYGRARESILGRGDDLLHAPEVAHEMRELDRRILATGETVSFEADYSMPDRRRTYLVFKFPLRRSDGAIYAVAGIATDITELRDAETGRRAVERKLLEAQKLESLGILAGGVAHDFNNLLTGILGHANLARARLAPSSPAQA